MSIEQELLIWDGKSSDDIQAIYAHHNSTPAFVAKLIELCQQSDFQKGVTWLLKHHFEAGQALTEKATAALFELLPSLKHWESKLHMLQSLPYLKIASADKHKVEALLRECLTDNNKFVRAWAYNGFYELSRQYPEYEEESRQLFEMAMRDETPSVKARIRNIIKKGL